MAERDIPTPKDVAIRKPITKAAARAKRKGWVARITNLELPRACVPVSKLLTCGVELPVSVYYSRAFREWNGTCFTVVEVNRYGMKTAFVVAINTTSGLEMSELRRIDSSEEDLLQRLDRANKTIRTLEQRVAMQERTYMTAMQEKKQQIRELQLSLQSKQ